VGRIELTGRLKQPFHEVSGHKTQAKKNIIRILVLEDISAGTVLVCTDACRDVSFEET